MESKHNELINWEAPLFAIVARLSEEVSRGIVSPRKAGEAVELELSTAFALGELTGAQARELKELWCTYEAAAIGLPDKRRPNLHLDFCHDFLDELIPQHHHTQKLLAPVG